MWGVINELELKHLDLKDKHKNLEREGKAMHVEVTLSNKDANTAQTCINDLQK